MQISNYSIPYAPNEPPAGTGVDSSNVTSDMEQCAGTFDPSTWMSSRLQGSEKTEAHHAKRAWGNRRAEVLTSTDVETNNVARQKPQWNGHWGKHKGGKLR
jgi:hypothetical protein